MPVAVAVPSAVMASTAVVTEDAARSAAVASNGKTVVRRAGRRRASRRIVAVAVGPARASVARESTASAAVAAERPARAAVATGGFWVVAIATDWTVLSAASKAVTAPSSVVRRSARLWPSRCHRPSRRQPPS